MRLSNTNNFSASFNVATPYQMVVIHSSKLIYPRELYQRGIQRKRVELIARDFNEYTANEPKVSFRNGRYYVTDGQHTIEARILRNGGKDLPILCKVYTRSTSRSTSTLLRTSRGSDTSACKTVGHRTSIFKNNETARIGGCRPCACKIRLLTDFFRSLQEIKKKSTILQTKYSAFLVENTGIEPVTSCMPCKRSPS